MSPRVRESWDDVCLKASDLNLPMKFACKRVGIRGARAETYISGNVSPDEATVNKIMSYLLKIEQKRKTFYADQFGYDLGSHTVDNLK